MVFFECTNFWLVFTGNQNETEAHFGGHTPPTSPITAQDNSSSGSSEGCVSTGDLRKPGEFGRLQMGEEKNKEKKKKEKMKRDSTPQSQPARRSCRRLSAGVRWMSRRAGLLPRGGSGHPTQLKRNSKKKERGTKGEREKGTKRKEREREKEEKNTETKRSSALSHHSSQARKTKCFGIACSNQWIQAANRGKAARNLPRTSGATASASRFLRSDILAPVKLVASRGAPLRCRKQRELLTGAVRLQDTSIIQGGRFAERRRLSQMPQSQPPPQVQTRKAQASLLISLGGLWHTRCLSQIWTGWMMLQHCLRCGGIDSQHACRLPHFSCRAVCCFCITPPGVGPFRHGNHCMFHPPHPLPRTACL